MGAPTIRTRSVCTGTSKADRSPACRVVAESKNHDEHHDLAGVLPATRRHFQPDLSVDHAFLARHCAWLVDNGCTGIVALGSLGEGQTLRLEEKREVLKTCVDAVGSRVPIVAGVSALSTADAVEIARTADDAGAAA